jgi:formamidopyrimidine-DNA glycosylase
MPELPEVETVCQGLKPLLLQRRITEVVLRQPQLRWPVPQTLPHELVGQTFLHLERRAKYLLFGLNHGTLIGHLGMSGSFRLCIPQEPLKKHDHILIGLNNQKQLRYHDPRRFGSLHWTTAPVSEHPLINKLGPEPLDPNFSAIQLHEALRHRQKSIKACLMDHHLLVGVGNIYATEALFACRIHPLRPAKLITKQESAALLAKIRQLLNHAITQGGTTLRDFVNADAKPGYFQQTLLVYGKNKTPCSHCQTLLESITIAQRSSVFCPKCQPL